MNVLNNRSVIGSLLLLSFSLFYLQIALSLPIDVLNDEEVFTSRTMPVIFSVGSILCCMMQLTVSLFGTRHSDSEEDLIQTLGQFNWSPLFALTAMMFGYAFAFSYLGFVLSGILFLFSSILVLGERRFVRAAVIAGGLVVSLWALLSKVFGLNLAAGTLFV